MNRPGNVGVGRAANRRLVAIAGRRGNVIWLRRRGVIGRGLRAVHQRLARLLAREKPLREPADLSVSRRARQQQSGD